MYALLKPCAQDGSDPDVLVTGVRQMYSHSDCLYQGQARMERTTPSKRSQFTKNPVKQATRRLFTRNPSKQVLNNQPTRNQNMGARESMNKNELPPSVSIVQR